MPKRYFERIVNKSRRTNLQVILRKHKIKQYELAQETEMDAAMISRICSGKKSDILLSTAMRICNALNDFVEERDEKEMKYNLHDVFFD